MIKRIKTITEIKMVRIVSIGYGYTKHPIVWIEVPYENEEQVNNLLKKVEKKIAEKTFYERPNPPKAIFFWKVEEVKNEEICIEH